MRISYTIRSIQLARAKCSNSKKVRFIHSQRALAVCAHKLKANRLRPSQTMINHHAERGRERKRESALRESLDIPALREALRCCFVACLWLLLVLSLFLYLPRAIPKWLWVMTLCRHSAGGHGGDMTYVSPCTGELNSPISWSPWWPP